MEKLEQIEINTGHLHEALDRIEIIQSMTLQLLELHPAIQATNQEKRIAKIYKQLHKMYQEIGAELDSVENLGCQMFKVDLNDGIPPEVEGFLKFIGAPLPNLPKDSNQ